MPNPTTTKLPPGHPMADMADELHQIAKELLWELWDEVAFQKAAEGKGSSLRDLLLSDAFALCGSPYYRVSKHHWDSAARRFLEVFVSTRLGVVR